MKSDVADLVLNLCVHWKKQTILPLSFAYAGMPYHLSDRAASASVSDQFDS